VRFPFIKHEAFRSLSENEINLYKYMFAPDLQPQTLAVIGCVDPLGPNPPLMEMQCRIAVRVFKVRYGTIRLFNVRSKARKSVKVRDWNKVPDGIKVPIF